MNTSGIYETKEDKTEQDIQYIFISKGEKNIIKAVQYSYVQDLSGRRVFNLGFGDYDIETENITDDINTNNGDVYTVFNTVLSTIPKFFESYNNVILMVQGSDNGADFIDKCRLICKKKCKDICKNINRRIAVYRSYINKKFEELQLSYSFYGGIKCDDNQLVIEDYECQKKYDSVFLMKKND